MCKKMKKKTIGLIATFSIVAGSLLGCSEADKVNYNLSKQADYFDIERKITVYNARTDYIIFEAEGYMSISNDGNNELVITCKVGTDSYKKIMSI